MFSPTLLLCFFFLFFFFLVSGSCSFRFKHAMVPWIHAVVDSMTVISSWFGARELRELIQWRLPGNPWVGKSTLLHNYTIHTYNDLNMLLYCCNSVRPLYNPTDYYSIEPLPQWSLHNLCKAWYVGQTVLHGAATP